MSRRTYDAVGVQSLLAHRYPFLLVDRIEVLSPGRQVVGFKRLSTGEWWAAAGTGGELPFLLVIEALAQASGALVADLANGLERTVAYIVAADRVRFRRPARTGEELRLEASLRQWRRGVCKIHGIATVDGDVVATADLTTIVRGSTQA